MDETRRVLVVASDAAFARSLEILLEDELRVAVMTSTSARLAVALLEVAIEPPWLVLADADVGRDGVRDLAAACGRRSRPVPLVLLTAGHPVVAGGAGARAVVVKPVEPDDLLTLLTPLLA